MRKNLEKQFIREDGLLRIGSKVEVIPGTNTMTRLTPGINYTISKIYENETGNKISIELLEIKEEVFNGDDFRIIPVEFDVYKWKGYYILAISVEQAQRIWQTWIDKLNIMAADGKPELLKYIKNLLNTQDKELFPYRIKMKCEYSFPCIVKDLEWEENPVFVYKYME